MNGVDHQRAFAARIRQPEAEPLLPGIAAERMAVYEELFFNNIEGFVSGAFPVLRSLFDEARWRSLLRAFIAAHRATTPYFLAISQEFLAWLQQGYRAQAGDPPFILELAHYEWVELALDVSEAELPARGWSPLAWPLAYAWPVHRLSPDYQPETPPETATFLLVRRDAGYKVRFSELSALTFRLLQRLSEFPDLSGRAQLLALAAEAQAGDADAFVAQGRDMFEQLRADGVVLGTLPS